MVSVRTFNRSAVFTAAVAERARAKAHFSLEGEVCYNGVVATNSETLASELIARNRDERLAHERRAADLRAQLAVLAPSLGATRVWIIGSPSRNAC